MIHRKLDTATQVFFYEQKFYVLSNFSAFSMERYGLRFDTSENLYHFERFLGVGDYDGDSDLCLRIQRAVSAHEAFRIAQENKHLQNPEWDEIKVAVMRGILWEKAARHEYVARKLEETGDRELIEDSWRDPFWGWGELRNGRNMLGQLWMEVRAERRR